MMYKKVSIASALSLAANVVLADGVVIDKVYHPYVDALENELEYRVLHQDPQPGLTTPSQLHQLSFGRSLNDRFFAEAYVIAEKSRTGNFSIEAVEVELKWQFSEQGEYSADYGFFLEIEEELNKSIHEITVGALIEKEFGQWSAATNLFVISEFGSDIQDELETSLAAQLRYRYSRTLEPGWELYVGQDARGTGPVLQGQINMGIRKNLHWEAGVIFGLDKKSPDQTLRVLFEYEF